MKNKILLLLCSVILVGATPYSHAKLSPFVAAVAAWGVYGMSSATITGITHQLLKSPKAKEYSAIAIAIGAASITAQAMLPFGTQMLRKSISDEGKEENNIRPATSLFNIITNPFAQFLLWKISPDNERIGSSVICGIIGGTAGNVLIMNA